MSSIELFTLSSRNRQSGGAIGYIHSVETCGAVDGPGIRYVVFTVGCPLRCVYCHNPDCRTAKNGWRVSSTDLLEDIARYTNFLLSSGGGVTISGGEPLSQPALVADLLRGCREMGLHTALDTSGYPGWCSSDSLLRDADLVLLDIKSFLPNIYQEITGVPVQPTLEFARRLERLGRPTWIRFVLVPGLSDDPENVAGLADFVATLGNVERIEIVPFHKMGEFKWKELNLICNYRLEKTPSPSSEQYQEACRIFRERGVHVSERD